MKERRGFLMSEMFPREHPVAHEPLPRHFWQQTSDHEKTKWRLLRRSGKAHPWISLNEIRRCRLCGATFSGREILVCNDALLGLRLHCPTPGCGSEPLHWVAPHTECLSEDGWRKWNRLLEQLNQRPDPVSDAKAGRAGRQGR